MQVKANPLLVNERASDEKPVTCRRKIQMAEKWAVKQSHRQC